MSIRGEKQGYLLDDAIRGRVIHLQDVPRRLLTVLGRTHSRRIQRVVKDVIEHTDLDHLPRIVLGEEIEDALKEMREFLYEAVYENPVVHDEFGKGQKMLEELFHLFVDKPELFKRISHQPIEDALEQRERAVCDFLAGMTDRYATRLFELLFIPRPWPMKLG